MAMGAAGAGKITVSDSETVALSTNLIMEMNPGCAELPRLAKYEAMYERFRIAKLRVEYVPLSGMATAGSVVITIQPGPTNPKIKDRDSATKCLPLLMRPAWKAGSLVAGANIDSSRFLHAGNTTADGVALTIYAFPSAADLGSLRVHYTVEFSFPHPF